VPRAKNDREHGRDDDIDRRSGERNRQFVARGRAALNRSDAAHRVERDIADAVAEALGDQRVA
jgi:hypothetical protein